MIHSFGLSDRSSLGEDIDAADGALLLREALELLLVAAQSLVVRPQAFPAAAQTLSTARALLQLYGRCLGALPEKKRPEKADADALEAHLNDLAAALQKPSLQLSPDTSCSILRLFVSGSSPFSSFLRNPTLLHCSFLLSAPVYLKY